MPKNIPNNNGRHHTKESKQKISKAIEKLYQDGKISPFKYIPREKRLRGDKHPNWRGGLTSENDTIRNSFEYKLWRESVFERDDYTCVWCGAHSGCGTKITLQADHIKSFALFPELRFDIDNGRTLCIDCHKKTPTYDRNVPIDFKIDGKDISESLREIIVK